MHPITWLASTTTPPTPSPSMTVNPDSVTPGVPGFIAIAVIAIAVVLLLVDMLRRVRRARYRAEIAEELDAEAAARDSAAGDHDGQAVDGSAGDAPDVSPGSPAKD